MRINIYREKTRRFVFSCLENQGRPAGLGFGLVTKESNADKNAEESYFCTEPSKIGPSLPLKKQKRESSFCRDFVPKKGGGKRNVKKLVFRQDRHADDPRSHITQTDVAASDVEVHPDRGIRPHDRVGRVFEGVGDTRRGDTTGHLQSSVCRLQVPGVTGEHSQCFQQVQEDMEKKNNI
jgi:hypothetical protein